MKTLLKSLPILLVMLFAGAPADAAKQTYKSGDPTPNIRCSELRHCIIRFPAGVEFIEYILSDPPSWIVEAGTYGRDQRYFVAARPRQCGTTSLLTIPTTEDLFQAVLVAEPCDLKGPGVGDDLQILRDKLATPVEVPAAAKAPAAVEKVQEAPKPPAEPLLHEPLEVAKVGRRLRKMGVSVVRSGSKTFFILSQPEKGVPAIARRGAGGRLEGVLTSRFTGNRLEVDERLDRGWVVFAGKKKMKFRFKEV
jgi:hypothetical protein